MPNKKKTKKEYTICSDSVDVKPGVLFYWSEEEIEKTKGGNGWVSDIEKATRYKKVEVEHYKILEDLQERTLEFKKTGVKNLHFPHCKSWSSKEIETKEKVFSPIANADSFVFAIQEMVHETFNGAIVYLNPKDFWEKEKGLKYSYSSEEQVIVDNICKSVGLGELQESVFETEEGVSQKAVHNALISSGLVFDPTFQQFLDYGNSVSNER